MILTIKISFHREVRAPFPQVVSRRTCIYSKAKDLLPPRSSQARVTKFKTRTHVVEERVIIAVFNSWERFTATFCNNAFPISV